MNNLMTIGLIVAGLIMIVIPIFGEWFKDLADEDDWTDKW
tara:strand:+ start:787 stop:906 length:120 start_codon:yes stop_codon:yes gene_type:complete